MGSISNFHVDDDPTLRYGWYKFDPYFVCLHEFVLILSPLVPYFGEQDVTGLDVSFYDVVPGEDKSISLLVDFRHHFIIFSPSFLSAIHKLNIHVYFYSELLLFDLFYYHLKCFIYVK